jgi:uncharacterized membrane protein
MKRFIAFMAMGLALATVPVIGATQNTAKQKSMEQNGRFHQIHTKTLAKDCVACHKTEQKEVLLQVPRARMVDRQICLACHKQGSKPAWYGVAVH